MSDARRRSPLAHRKTLNAQGDALAMAEAPHFDRFVLRGQAVVLGEQVAKIVGIELPLEAGTFRADRTQERRLIWVSPDEWMAVVPGGDGARLGAELAAALAGQHSQIVDVSDYYTSISFSGLNARAALMKISLIDLHEEVFRPGNAISSIYAKAPAILSCLEPASKKGEQFELVVRRSLADYLWCLLADAGREFGLAMQEPIGVVPLHRPGAEN